MKKTSRHGMSIRRALSAMLCGLLGGAAPLGAGDKPLVKLVYALPTAVPVAMPYIAIEKGFFREEGLDVEAQMFSSGREALQALFAKSAQIQSVSETPVAHAILQGNDIMTVATVAEHMEAKLIARRDRGIAKPQDLVNKRIATQPGTNSDYFMYRFFEKHGIPLEKVQITNMKTPEMVVAYAKGDIDGYFAWEPHIYYGRRQLPEQSLVFPPGELYRGRSTVNMNRDFVEQNPDVVRRIVRALLRTEAFMRDNPQEARGIVAQKLKMDVAVLEELWNEHEFKVQLDEGYLTLLREIGAWAARQAKSDKPLPDFRRSIYIDALQKERPDRVSEVLKR